MKKLMIVLVLVIAGCSSDYSNGFRVGVVTKFSEKGWFYKTWEGELDLGRLKNSGEGRLVRDLWYFSVDREQKRHENIKEIIKQLNYCVETGEKCKVWYAQEKLTDWNSSRGSSEYYIQKVEVIGN